MAELRSEKYVNSLPPTLIANTIYYVKNGATIDIYITNNSGTIIAYPLSSTVGGGAAWGGITGTLSSQTDLKSVLDKKLYISEWGAWYPFGSGDTGFTSIGMTTTVVGTASGVNNSSINKGTRTKKVQYSSAATAGSFIEHRSRNTMYSAGSGTAGDYSGFLFRTMITPLGPSSLSRFFCGVTANANLAATNVEPSTLINTVGIAQLSTDNTQFYLVYGGSVAQTPIPLGTALLSMNSTFTSACFEIKISAPQTIANTYIVTVTNIVNGVSVTNTITGNSTVIPQSGNMIGHKIWGCNNLTASAFSYYQHSIYYHIES